MKTDRAEESRHRLKSSLAETAWLTKPGINFPQNPGRGARIQAFARGYHSCSPSMINRAWRPPRLAFFVATLIVATLALARQGNEPTTTLQIDEVMHSHAAAGDFSGSALVARDGRILYQRAFGYANLEWKIPNDLQTKFEIGSMTKQFTAL